MLRLCLFLLLCLTGETLFAQNPKHRLIILADMGNEPDEVQRQD